MDILSISKTSGLFPQGNSLSCFQLNWSDSFKVQQANAFNFLTSAFKTLLLLACVCAFLKLLRKVYQASLHFWPNSKCCFWSRMESRVGSLVVFWLCFLFGFFCFFFFLGGEKKLSLQ